MIIAVIILKKNICFLVKKEIYMNIIPIIRKGHKHFFI